MGLLEDVGAILNDAGEGAVDTIGDLNLPPEAGLIGVPAAAFLAPYLNHARLSLGDAYYSPVTNKIKLPSKGGIMAAYPGFLFRPSQVEDLKKIFEYHENREKILSHLLGKNRQARIFRPSLLRERVGRGLGGALMLPLLPLNGALNIADAFNPKATKLVGQHASPAVLAYESNELLKNYPNSHARKVMMKLRKRTREARLLEEITGKRYGIDKFTKADRMKLLQATSHKGKGVSLQTVKFQKAKNMKDALKALIHTSPGKARGFLKGLRKMLGRG